MAGLDYWSYVLVSVSIISGTLATIIFVLRLCCRRFGGAGIKSEDFLMGIGLLFSYGLVVCTFIAVFNGVGHHIGSLPEGTRRRVTLVFWLGQKFWIISQVFVKVSILELVRKLFSTTRRLRITVTALLTLTVVWGVIAFIGDIFLCWPPQHFWIKNMDGHCMNSQRAFFMVIGSVSLVEDIVILLVPLIEVWQMHMAPRQKVQIMLLVSLGCLACIFSLLRVIELRHYATENVTASGALETIWALLELHCAVACSSLILLTPIYRRCHQFWKSNCCSQRQVKNTGRSSDCDYIFGTWPYDVSFWHGGGSQLQSEACYAPEALSAAKEFSSDTRNITVQTSIDQVVDDRAVAFPSEEASPESV
ncbi:uncharacterized protein ATNIH1004_007440 [Aspergillus tanneri]|uniref:Rhodopsin domain-containing protein n=1 Tax=Aspergillus tanneri TaxID=1220188 RepID=A0A5M9MGC2_9EURO|nr:uncharacterized protein ATNIH1004_007440 [Aspergillus tanneri]KAA8646018.1 hypothetical protein ATNIH1004_007440 [Aspergillus tanneri]